MGSPRPLEEAILFVGSLFSDHEIFRTALGMLKKDFGDILYESPPLPWNFSDHYDKELGTPIYKNFIFFDTLIDPSYLVDAKLITNEIEITFSKDNKRQINLDPGYITLAKAVLASTKNYAHRIYLGRGIYGEVTLLYSRDNRFIPLPYTYNDYKDKTFLNIFLKARSLLKNIVT